MEETMLFELFLHIFACLFTIKKRNNFFKLSPIQSCLGPVFSETWQAEFLGKMLHMTLLFAKPMRNFLKL